MNTRTKSCKHSYWSYNYSASIIYHLKASARIQHQSCLLLFNSTDLLMTKVWLMYKSFYLWVNCNQYRGSIMFLCTVWKIREQVQTGKRKLWKQGGTWQSRTNDWQVDLTGVTLNWGIQFNSSVMQVPPVHKADANHWQTDCLSSSQ